MGRTDEPTTTLVQALQPDLLASLRDAAAPLPFVATAPPPHPGDTVDLAAVLGAQADGVDLSRLKAALSQVLTPLHAHGGGMVDRRTALATLRETRPIAADLPPPPWVKS